MWLGPESIFFFSSRVLKKYNLETENEEKPTPLYVIMQHTHSVVTNSLRERYFASCECILFWYQENGIVEEEFNSIIQLF